MYTYNHTKLRLELPPKFSCSKTAAIMLKQHVSILIPWKWNQVIISTILHKHIKTFYAWWPDWWSYRIEILIIFALPTIDVWSHVFTIKFDCTWNANIVIYYTSFPCRYRRKADFSDIGRKSVSWLLVKAGNAHPLARAGIASDGFTTANETADGTTWHLNRLTPKFISIIKFYNSSYLYTYTQVYIG